MRLIIGLVLLAISTNACVEAADLPNWNDAPSKAAIVDFVARVVKEGGPDYVPPAERIAVFDNDGPLWCEQPMYVQMAFVLDRVKTLSAQHPEWEEKESNGGQPTFWPAP